MAVWLDRVDLTDIWRAAENVPPSGPEFERFRDEIVDRIKRSSFYGEDDEDLVSIVTDLSDTVDLDDFNYYWQDFYDWADRNRVWVATF